MRGEGTENYASFFSFPSKKLNTTQLLIGKLPTDRNTQPDQGKQGTEPSGKLTELSLLSIILDILSGGSNTGIRLKASRFTRAKHTIPNPTKRSKGII
mmetsp:Transcript_22715/g.34058  ORF Transcript_22715/g.34058 Transcript_22715/m.34058 type:complete len:98 (-) Transcript_22715:2356-2649(-)